jgi:hypothetical protein
MNLAQRCGLVGAQRQAQCSALLQRLRDTGVAQLRVTWCDLHGQLRSKALVCGNDAAAVADALLSGVGMVSTVLLKDSSDRTAFKVFEPGALQAQPALRGFGAANNVLLLPDPASFLPLPWAPAHGLAARRTLLGRRHGSGGLTRAACCKGRWRSCMRPVSGCAAGWKSSSTSTASSMTCWPQTAPPGRPSLRRCNWSTPATTCSPTRTDLADERR